MFSGLISRHFDDTGRVTPRNNPWRAWEIEKNKHSQQAPLDKIRWPHSPLDVTPELVQELQSVLWKCSDEPRSLRKYFTFKHLSRLLKQARQLFKSYPNVVTVELPDEHTEFTIIGDTHGQFHDLVQIFEENGNPSPVNWYLINGDFVDRGSWGMENCVLLFAYKILYPQAVHVLRGNHETLYCTRMYGFYQECKHKFSKAIHSKLQQTFSKLPLAAVVLPRRDPDVLPIPEDEKDPLVYGDGLGVFVVHGGLYRNPDGSMGTLEDLQELDRNIKDPDCEPILDLLWSDPGDSYGMIDNYMRGCATFFGANATQDFLEIHGLSLIVRSHEGPDARAKRPHFPGDMMDGYSIDHFNEDTMEPILITVFSAPDYPQGQSSRGNSACYMVFPKEYNDILEYEFRQFDAAPRPPVKPYPAENKPLSDHE